MTSPVAPDSREYFEVPEGQYLGILAVAHFGCAIRAELQEYEGEPVTFPTWGELG